MSNRDWKTIKTYTDILFEEYNNVAKITFNRPEVYTASRPETVNALIDAFNTCRERTDIRVVILTGIGDIEIQTRQTLSNVEAVLKEGGADWSDVLKCNVYLKDMNDFQRMNNIFSEVFPDNPPARTTVQTPMAEETMLIEIEAVAYIGD